MNINADGWLAGAKHFTSPNYAPRAEGVRPTLVVIHAISLPPREFGGDAVAALFLNTLEPDAHPYFAAIAHLRVSAHFFIDRDGLVQQFVSTNNVAWHAGVSIWKNQEACNGFSIGIELEGCDELPFTDAQYAALQYTLAALKVRYPSLEDAAAHSDIAPGRKTDPGPCFDWARVDAAWQRWRDDATRVDSN
jgi:N-acetyl-anhydromuramoyl-L-alanine amidase